VPTVVVVGFTETARTGVRLLTVIERFAVAEAEAESVTLTVKDEVPAVVGVPVIAPVAILRASPPGRVPDAIDQV
jgi:hypothetical protein